MMGTQIQIYRSASTDDYDILKLTLASHLFFSFNVSYCVLLVVIIFYLIQSQTIFKKTTPNTFAFYSISFFSSSLCFV